MWQINMLIWVFYPNMHHVEASLSVFTLYQLIFFPLENIFKCKEHPLPDLKVQWAYPSMLPSVQSQAVLAGRRCGFFHQRPRGLHYTSLPFLCLHFPIPSRPPSLSPSPHSFHLLFSTALLCLKSSFKSSVLHLLSFLPFFSYFIFTQLSLWV